MLLRVFGSGSDGNCFSLMNDKEILLLDAGVKYKEVLKGIDYRISDVVCVLVTHCHGDHAKYVEEFEKYGIPVYKPYEDGVYKKYQMESFEIFTFDCKHNVPCYGFVIKHPDIGTLLYATDTCYIKYRFRNLNHIIVECNWSKKYVDTSAVKYKHELEDHMEKNTCMEFIKTNCTDELKTVVLAHLSSSAINPSELMVELEKIVPCAKYIATKGLEIELTQ